MRAWQHVRELSARLVLAALPLLLAAAGCGAEGDQRPREPVSGTVTFEGKPLDNGTIEFQPSSAAEAVAAGGTVAQGRFAIPKDAGPVPGKYRVAIYDQANTATTGSAEGGGPVAATRKSLAELRGAIPPRYNSATELTADVKAGGPNRFSFELKK
jgi:hypothetical protein